MQPIWVLSVDLQTKTATFQSGLSDAARSARGAFGEMRGGAGEMGREVGRNTDNTRSHAHRFNVQRIDGDGMQGALEKHSDQLQRHVEKTLRRLNR